MQQSIEHECDRTWLHCVIEVEKAIALFVDCISFAVIPIQIMFAPDKFFVGARHPQSFGIFNDLTDAVPLPIRLEFELILIIHTA
ncbi:hypothetical protein BV378_01420 [Nostoc sp. RF31YmG]|jgi:hypothetical protein|nr:hypothetical protein BV378_01420 [Nostoc sp. RF31YmG]